MPRHMLTHGDSHMVNCEICGTRMRADNMPRHLRTHEKTTCEVCHKVLSVRYMPEHMKLYAAGLPKKQCPECGKMISANFFNRHVKNHTGEAAMKICPVCGKMMTPTSINRHLKKQHPSYKKPGVATGRVEKPSSSNASSSKK